MNTTQKITVADMVAWLNRFRDLVTTQQTFLTELDSVIGDADHGANVVRGTDAVKARLDTSALETMDELFTEIGMTLVTSVGGSSGPLYGTFFLRLGMSAGARSEIGAAAFGAALRAGLEGIVARGKAEPGDKTMVDAMAPAIEAWEAALRDGGDLRTLTEAAFLSARDGRDATLPLVARKGRASYLGERSAGHIDPGSASTAILFEALRDALTRAGE